MAKKRKTQAAQPTNATRRQATAPATSGATESAVSSKSAGSMSDRRQDRARGRRASIEAQRRRKRIQRIALISGGVLVLAIAAFFFFRDSFEEPIEQITSGVATASDPGQFIPPQSANHVGQGTRVTNYRSNPPTSGDHYPSTARWGISDVPLQDEFMVHNLEHGGIIIQYDCPEGCPEVVQQLTEIVSPYPVKLILAPRENMDHMIAVTAWSRLLTLDEVNVEQIQAFIDAYIDRGPEKIQSETDALRAAGF
ncbi:MAG: hypothetical protein DCC58_14525 [Chloroflexi bacterium]|nr:MAG: hypothetical protein DCC58_14525 [Chloroflexota bacterium]